MKKFLGAVFVALLISGASRPVWADEKDTTAIIDKATMALGGEEKLTKANVVSWKSKGTLTLNGNDSEISTRVTFQGLDHYRVEFEVKSADNEFKGVTVVNGDKGWRKFGDMDQDIEAGDIATEKRRLYIQAIPALLVHLKSKDFKTEAAAEEKVGDKPAAVIKVTGPDGKDFKLYFDKESGLPVRLVAQVIGFGGDEFTEDTTYSNYKDFDGIKKATKVSSKHDGDKFVDVEVSEFKVLDKVGPETFSQPK
jgi:hypothetical protein